MINTPAITKACRPCERQREREKGERVLVVGGGDGGGGVAGKGGCRADTVDKTAPVSLGHAFITGMPRHRSAEGDPQ